jgi:HEAT repeat protein
VSRAASLLRVEPGEGRIVLLVVAAMFVGTAGYTIGESGVGALFFDHVGADALPTIYLAQGAAGIAAMLVLTGWMGRAEPRRAYVAIPVGAAAVVLLERVALGIDVGGIYQILWLTMAVVMLVQAVFLWGTAGLVTDTRRAKRLFPLFAAGGILGSVIGGLGTGPLARWIGTENLLVVWALTLLGTAVLCASVLRGGRRGARRRSKGPSAIREIAIGFSFVRRSPLLVWMTAAAVLFSVLFFSLYLPFAQEATARYPDPDELAGFLGIYWAGITAAAFFVSVLLANRLLGWLGAGTLILVLPVLYAGSFGLLLATTTFATVVTTRFVVSVWLQGVASPAWETLVNVVPESRRDQTRAFLNGGPAQVGTAIAGVLQLVGQQVLSAGQLSLIGLTAAAVTIVVARGIRRSYARALVDALRLGRPIVFEEARFVGVPIVAEPDAQAVGTAVDAAQSEDVRVRRLGVELLSEAAEDEAREALAEATGDEDAAVRAHAVTGLGRVGEPRDLPAIERALADPDPTVRRAAVDALRSSPEQIPRATLRDADPRVATAAAAALLRTDDARTEAVAVLRARLADPDPGVRTDALSELRTSDPEDASMLLSALPDTDSATVRMALLETLARVDPEAAIGEALEALGAEDPSLREAGLHVLLRLDLRDHGAELRSIAEEQTVLAILDAELAASIPADEEATALLRDAVVRRGRGRAVVALSTLALQSDDRGAAHVALDNLDTRDPLQLSNALEALEVTTDPALLRPMLALWETMPAPPRLAGSEWLARASVDDDPFIRSCADLVHAVRDGWVPEPDDPVVSQGDDMTRSRTSMSPMERVIELRRIPLFAELSPADLHRLAAVAEERSYHDGELVAAEGELGDELHVVVDGTVAVTHGDTLVARRGAGEVVGELSIITRSPRVASLTADGGVRTIAIGQREFESMIRERPEIALAVMRVLAQRLTELDHVASHHATG